MPTARRTTTTLTEAVAPVELDVDDLAAETAPEPAPEPQPVERRGPWLDTDRSGTWRVMGVDHHGRETVLFVSGRNRADAETALAAYTAELDA